MATLTDEQRLAELDEAIHNVATGGQVRQIRGKRVEYPSLEELRAQRAEVVSRINAGRPRSTYLRRRRG